MTSFQMHRSGVPGPASMQMRFNQGLSRCLRQLLVELLGLWPAAPLRSGHGHREGMVRDTQFSGAVPGSSPMGSLATLSKMLAHCEVLCFPAFPVRAKMTLRFLL